MKLVKIFGIVMAFHGVAFLFIFAIPGCRSTAKKPAATATAPAIDTGSPLIATETGAPSTYPESSSAVRFSPTRPGTPAAAEVTTQAAPAPVTYTVVKGDSLWSIARKNNVTVKEIAAVNKIRADAPLKLGQRLVIPGKAPAPAAPSTSITSVAPGTPAAPTTKTITHIVKAGETLGGIAKKYQVKIGEIATANNIADPTKIRVGQSLKIPGWQVPASKSATATVRPAPAVPTPAPAPALAKPAPAPLAPVFTSPVEPTPAPIFENESPFVTPPPESEAPVISVEESGAPKFE